MSTTSYQFRAPALARTFAEQLAARGVSCTLSHRVVDVVDADAETRRLAAEVRGFVREPIALRMGGVAAALHSHDVNGGRP